MPWGGECLVESYPEDLSRDVGDPVLLQCVSLGVFHQVCDGASTTELHHQLHTHTNTRTTNKGMFRDVQCNGGQTRLLIFINRKLERTECCNHNNLH